MDYFAGLDVSVKDTNVCIVDDTGKIIREVKVASEPEALLAVLKCPPLQANWIGSRAAVAMAVQRARRSRATGDLCRDAAHAGGAEGADQQDRPADARGITQMMRVGLYRPVHVKTLRSQKKLRMLLTHRTSRCNRRRSPSRNRPAWHVTKLRPQGGYGGHSEVRGPHQEACREPSRPGGSGRTDAYCPAGATRTISSSCIAACWPSSGMTRCAGA